MEIKGFLTEIDGELMYCIKNFDAMDPFFMSIVSSSDLWMFISSSGSLTAGRQNFNNALFPYYTDDKIHDSSEITGPKTIIRIVHNDRLIVWEPFSNLYQGIYDVSRNIYKNTAGSKIIFEEINNDLKIRFAYSWMSSDNLGWVRKCVIENLSENEIQIDITDGLQNILPYGITRDTQSMMSTLMDAYKVAEWLPEVGIALFRMSSIPVDRAEPSEALRTNCVWTNGLNTSKVLLSSKKINSIRFGAEVESEKNVFGIKTSFFVHDKLSIAAKENKVWYFIADVAKDSSEIIEIQQQIKATHNLTAFIEQSIAESSSKLNSLVAFADGVQVTGDKLNDKRHFANVMFNIMRGGIFENNYEINLNDFLKHLQQSSSNVFLSCKVLYVDTPSTTSIENLLEIAHKSGNLDHIRLTFEYLPISFSRRHGDPSRPWNFFDINIKNQDGTPSLNYQGNWRDIFQNWETLAFSFPQFLSGMICRFLNASTADGYNPYRITRNGFDWEVPEPENPWAYIGYWGDHQIIYLLKFLELSEKFYPGQLLKSFNRSSFVYANVPYRIKSYDEIFRNPQDTIVFNRQLHEAIMHRSQSIGADGKLLSYVNGDIIRVSFTEKLLVSLLTKLSNFVPDAGIWLNTQRPEWNDANNALVGNGASMVTLYHLRRFVLFFKRIVAENIHPKYSLSVEVKVFFNEIFKTLLLFTNNLVSGFNPESRIAIVQKLGNAGSDYRERVYKIFNGDFEDLSRDDLLDFLVLTLSYIDKSIESNKRSDGLYHSYNLLELSNDTIKVQNLQLMLEGQAAIMSSGVLSASDTKELLNSLFNSNLWREDQKSFLLYPFVNLPNFLDKNTIPANLVNESTLLLKLLEISNSEIIRKDCLGNFHFNSDLKNVSVLKEKLLNVSEIGDELTASEIDLVCSIYESVFQHRYFTGRSGSFYKYEGLGSIYWHLVSKLLQTLGESIVQFSKENESSHNLKPLKEYYYSIKYGIGVHKSPENYGAFPTDPYSHTPATMGAQQPGMTGQVKEDILSRFNELGLVVDNGEIIINPYLIKDEDFTSDDCAELTFSFCNTPFTYRRCENFSIDIYGDNKEKPVTIVTSVIPKDISQYIFARNKKIDKVVVCLKSLGV
jgi:hypothetical protein